MSEPKQYVGNAKAITTKYGGMLKISFGPDDIKKLNEIAKNNRGWVNLNCSKRKEVSEKGYTHSISIDDWKPDTDAVRQEMGANQAQSAEGGRGVQAHQPNIDPFNEDPLPF